MCLLFLSMTLFLSSVYLPVSAVVLSVSASVGWIIQRHREIWLWQSKSSGFYDYYNHNLNGTFVDDICLVHWTKKWSFPSSFPSKFDINPHFPAIWSHLLNKSLMENFILCAVVTTCAMCQSVLLFLCIFKRYTFHIIIIIIMIIIMVLCHIGLILKDRSGVSVITGN